MAKFLDTSHPIFRPLWVRVLIVVLSGAWAVVEFVVGSPFWGMLFGALAAYAGWHFFFDFRPGGGDQNPD